MGPNLAQEMQLGFNVMCPSVIKGCCSTMGNKSCPSVTWCLAAAVAGGACNLSFCNQWGDGS